MIFPFFFCFHFVYLLCVRVSEHYWGWPWELEVFIPRRRCRQGSGERERERGTIWPRVVSCNLCHLTSLTRGQPCLTRWGIKIITFVWRNIFLFCSRISLQSVHCQCSGDRLKIAEYLPEPWCSLTQGGREACVACIKWPQSRVLSERDRCTSNT